MQYAAFLLGLSLPGQTAYRNPVLPGDHPDPAVIRVGQEYWATATTSAWAPDAAARFSWFRLTATRAQ